jgi:DNA-binding MarR family transcriptional regulator
MVVLARTVIELNIKYYRELLERETNASTRRIIVKLLAEEEAKLAKLLADKSDEK